ncbi:HSP20-like chaperone, partial [Peniophora sp. CONT]
PRVDILASETQYVLEIEIPGVRKEDINALVSDDGQSITVEGIFPSRVENALERVYVERRIAPGEKFARTIPLPGPVDKESIGAKLSDGLLTITLVKVKVEE